MSASENPTENFTKKPHILVADDDPSVLSAFETALYGREDIALQLYSSSQEALSVLGKNPFLFALAFVDYYFKEEGPPLGHELARQLKALNSYLCVCLISGDKSPEALEKWLRAGVDKFMYKPLDKNFITSMVNYAVDAFHTQFSVSFASSSQKAHLREVQEKMGLIGISENIQHVAYQTLKFASTSESVLILGETGTGKEIVAKAIHNISFRRENPFIVVNCAAMTESLFESEFFGYTKGAFTGAQSNKKGKFELAHKGTLFLDEIHHLTLSQQAKILRAIQEKKVLPVGGSKEIPVDFRLVSASKPDLENRSEKKDFLIDLYYRISTLDIHITSLRTRPEDIKPLVHFFQSRNLHEHLSQKIFLPTTMDLLREYSWRGNVRELEKLVRKLSITVEGSSIHPEHLPPKFQTPQSLQSPVSYWASSAASFASSATSAEKEDSVQAEDAENAVSPHWENTESGVSEAAETYRAPERGFPPSESEKDSCSFFHKDGSSLLLSFEEMEKKLYAKMEHYILYILQKTDNNISRAARLMRISRTTLNSRIRTFNLQDKIKRF